MCLPYCFTLRCFSAVGKVHANETKTYNPVIIRFIHTKIVFGVERVQNQYWFVELIYLREEQSNWTEEHGLEQS